MDAVERQAEIVRLRGVVAAGGPAIVDALPRLADHLERAGMTGEAARVYAHASRVHRLNGFALKAMVMVKRALGLNPIDPAVDAERNDTLATIDPALRPIVATRLREIAERRDSGDSATA